MVNIDKKRDKTLDVAKGIAIICVVLGHAFQYSFGYKYVLSELFFLDRFFQSIYSFHMPFFMLISGYLFFYSNKKNFKALLLSKLKGIGIPMITFILLDNSLSYLKYVAQGDIIIFFTSLIMEIFHGWTMWFLFSLLLNMAIVLTITRMSQNFCIRYILMLMIFVCSMFISDSFVLSVHKFMFPFFCIGYVVKETNINIYRFSSNYKLMSIMTLFLVASILWFDKDTFIYTSGFCINGNITAQLFINCKRMLIALIVSITLIQYVHLISEKYDLCTLENLGKISLFIYGMNIFIDIMYTKICAYMGWAIEYNYVAPLVFAMCVIGMSHLLYPLVYKFPITRLLFLGR